MVLMGGIGALGFFLWWARRWAISRSEGGNPDGEVWSLQQLREMRGRGEISEEEFETLKVEVLESYRPGPERKDGASDGALPREAPPRGE